MWAGLLLSWQTPKSSPQSQNTLLPFWKLLCLSDGVQKLLAPFPSSFSPAHHPVWFNMCVDVIALGWKGLASNSDAKKKKKFPSYSTCTYNEMIDPLIPGNQREVLALTSFSRCSIRAARSRTGIQLGRFESIFTYYLLALGPLLLSDPQFPPL